MRATFLDHSSFLVELPSVTLLFDWWKGALPALRTDLPLIVFSSHWHEDHFNPAIFTLDADAYILGDMDAAWLCKKGASPDSLKRCRFLNGGEACSPLPGMTVETLTSTDEGVAFLVTADSKTVFHAGDLNWWHWEGEPDPWNPNMARDFKTFTEPLRGRPIDLALLPLDPRLDTNGFLGPKHFLEIADIRHFVPMHQWGNYGFTEQFLSCYPEFTEKTISVHEKGEFFEV